MQPAEQLHLYARGRVQGVWFRGHTEQAARALGLVGWVRNLEDGRVEALAQGPRPALERLLEAVRAGSPRSVVEGVEVHWEILGPALGPFEIRR